MKKQTISKLKDNLWKAFSLYIRQRDNYTCFTCGRTGTGSAIHAGHFIPSSTCGLFLRYHEKNVHAQCYNCNINLGGNGAEYYRRMVARYGQKEVDQLFKDKERITKWTPDDYIALTKEYKSRIKKSL